MLTVNKVAGNYSCRPNPSRPVMLSRVRLVYHAQPQSNPVIESSFQWICKVRRYNKSYPKQVRARLGLKFNRVSNALRRKCTCRSRRLTFCWIAWGLFISSQQPLREFQRRPNTKTVRTTKSVRTTYGSPGDYFSAWNLGLLIPDRSPKRAATFPSGF